MLPEGVSRFSLVEPWQWRQTFDGSQPYRLDGHALLRPQNHTEVSGYYPNSFFRVLDIACVLLMGSAIVARIPEIAQAHLLRDNRATLTALTML